MLRPPTKRLIHINSWPGVGKLTIARIIARELGYRLAGNHTLLNPAEALFDRANPLHGVLRQEIRDLIFPHAAQDAGASSIFTGALADKAFDHSLFQDYHLLAHQLDATHISITLNCNRQDNLHRLIGKDCSNLHKLTRPDVFIDLRQTYRLLKPVGIDKIELDVTIMTAMQAAVQIVAQIKRMD